MSPVTNSPIMFANGLTLNRIVFLNGSTDYIQINAYSNNGNGLIYVSSYFQGFLIR